MVFGPSCQNLGVWGWVDVTLCGLVFNLCFLGGCVGGWWWNECVFVGWDTKWHELLHLWWYCLFKFGVHTWSHICPCINIGFIQWISFCSIVVVDGGLLLLIVDCSWFNWLVSLIMSQCDSTGLAFASLHLHLLVSPKAGVSTYFPFSSPIGYLSS